jgi:molecular chaperone DnaK
MTDTQDPLKGKRVFGIDLGTTNSGVAVWDEARNEGRGGPVMLAGPDGDELVPSVVAWDRGRQAFLVGREAEAVRRHSPRQAAYSVKRFIGRAFVEAEVEAGVREMPYRLVPAGTGESRPPAAVDFGGDDGGGPVLGVPDVSAHVLARLRANAAAALGLPPEEVRHAVITVPAYFNNNQRQATRLAGRLAGWDVVDLLDEPTAAALAYGDTVLGEGERLLLVCDLGGGTFDVSLLDVGRDAAGYWFQARVADGDTHLGGDDIDTGLARWLAAEVGRQGGTARLDDHAVRDRLRRAAEQAKVALSGQESVGVDLLSLNVGGAARVALDRGQLEACAEPVRRRVRDIVRRAVEDVAGLSWGQIAEVILVGGQTLMPAVQRDLEGLTGRPPRVNDRPQLAVALGAAAYGHILSLGRERFHENTLINVIALALGIKLEDNTFEQLVPANVPLPYPSRPYLVTTTEDNQPSIRVEVLQGPRHARRADECVVLGTIPMEVLPAPARTPRIEVTFAVGADATLRIEVVDTRRDRREVWTTDLAASGGLAWRPQEPPPGQPPPAGQPGAHSTP